jgi:anti-anti-sigma regulatory factor
MQQVEMNRDEWRPDHRVILEVNSELDGRCATAIVKQVKRSLQDGSEVVVVDLSKIQDISLLGLAVLLDRANRAGVLPRLNFHLTDPLLRRFFVTMHDIQLENVS